MQVREIKVTFMCCEFSNIQRVPAMHSTKFVTLTNPVVTREVSATLNACQIVRNQNKSVTVVGHIALMTRIVAMADVTL